MPTFAYKAVATNGDVSRGLLLATDEKEAIDKIRAAGGIPIFAKRQNESTWLKIRSMFVDRGKNRSLGDKLEVFALQMASLLEAGIAVDESLDIIQKTGVDEIMADFAASIGVAIREGKSFADALESTGFAVPKIGANILLTSEASGNLAAGFRSLAAYLARTREAKERMKAALAYPIILASVSAVSLIAIFTFVIPQFSQLFSDMGDALPFLTRFVLGIAELLADWGWLIVALIIAGVLIIRYEFRKEARILSWHERVLSLPSVGDLVLRYQTERYCRSLGALLDSGMTLNHAMAIARQSLTNRFLINAAAKVEELVREGVGMSAALERSGPWPALAIQLIRVGERTGDLPSMLQRLADTFEQDVKSSTDKFLTVLEPLLVVLLGFFIAIIIISVLMGIMSVNDLPI